MSENSTSSSTASTKNFSFKGVVIGVVRRANLDQSNLVLLIKPENPNERSVGLENIVVYGVVNDAFLLPPASTSFQRPHYRRSSERRYSAPLSFGDTIVWNESECDHSKKIIRNFRKDVPLFPVKNCKEGTFIGISGCVDPERPDCFNTRIKSFQLPISETIDIEPNTNRFAWIQVKCNMLRSTDQLDLELSFYQFEPLKSAPKTDIRHKMFFSVERNELVESIEKKKLKEHGLEEMERRMKSYVPHINRIPLPPINLQLLHEKLDEVDKMNIITPESPISIFMYTSPAGVSACDFSEDSSLLAIGFSNSSIVVNALNPDNKLRKLKEPEFLEQLESDIGSYDADEAAGARSQIYEPALQSSVRYTGHGGPVFSVNFSPDRRLLLSSAGDRTVRLWSMDTQRNVVIYRTPTIVWQAQFCNRGLYFATASADKTAAVWCTDRMHPLRIFADAYGDVSCIDYHPNCNYVAGGSDDRYVRVWDVLTGTRVRIFGGHKAGVIAVKFSPCGRYIVSLDLVGNLMVWDLAYQRLVAAETADIQGTKGCISFSRDGGVFAVSFGTPSIQLFSLDTLITSVLAVGPADAHIEPKINMDGFNIGTYPTKQSSVIGLHFTRRNLLLGFGCFGQ